jgi:hypothetical protein
MPENDLASFRKIFEILLLGYHGFIIKNSKFNEF